MTRRTPYYLAACVLAGLARTAEPPARAQGAPRPTTAPQVMVQLRTSSAMTAAAVARSFQARVVAQLPGTGAFLMAPPPAMPAPALPDLAARMAADQRVLAASPNLLTGSGGLGGGQIGPEKAQWTTAFDQDRGPQAFLGQPNLTQVNTAQALRLADGSGITVAILDTGVSLRHPALRGHVVSGWNFVNNTSNTDDVPAGLDTNGDGLRDEGVGHGTAVAGLIARFAPRAKLLPIKTLDSDGQGTLWSTIAGIRFAIQRGARVINLSFGSPEDSGVLNKAIQDAWSRGIIIIVSAGNRDTDRPQFPAHRSETLSVAALNPDNTKADFSNYGSDIDVSAPGVDVATTFWDGTYVSWSGTSFSTALVSAEAALILSRSPRLRNDRVVRLIQDTSHSVDAVNPDFEGKLGGHGGGLIDMDAAILALTSPPGSGGGDGPQ